MIARLLFSALLLLLPGVAAAATAPCAPPPAVAKYLKAHPGWRILDMSDLSRDTKAFWRDEHKGLCPGPTRVVGDGSGLTSFGLALIRYRNGKAFERIDLLRANRKGGYSPITLAPAFEWAGVVVYRSPPLRMKDDFGTGKWVSTRYDGVIIELPESASQLYYLRHGKVRMIQLGD